MKKAFIILNEQHSLLPEQEKILKEQFETYEIISVPASGWTLEEMKIKIVELSTKNTIVFVSPIPYMIKELAKGGKVLVFHNDNRKKKELPNGKIIQVVAETGWQLV